MELFDQQSSSYIIIRDSFSYFPGLHIILERDSVEGRCMQMSDKFCVMHLKNLSCVSLHIVESSFVIESLHFIADALLARHAIFLPLY